MSFGTLLCECRCMNVETDMVNMLCSSPRVSHIRLFVLKFAGRIFDAVWQNTSDLCNDAGLNMSRDVTDGEG